MNTPPNISDSEWSREMDYQNREISAATCYDMCCPFCTSITVWMSRENKNYSIDCLVDYWKDEIEAILRTWILYDFDEQYESADYEAHDDEDDDFTHFSVCVGARIITITLADLELERVRQDLARISLSDQWEALKDSITNDSVEAWRDCSWGELPNYVRDEFGDAITLAELERKQKDFKAIND